jgi:hypothetical protein
MLFSGQAPLIKHPTPSVGGGSQPPMIVAFQDDLNGWLSFAGPFDWLISPSEKTPEFRPKAIQ